jgi:hypothetical protein
MLAPIPYDPPVTIIFFSSIRSPRSLGRDFRLTSGTLVNLERQGIPRPSFQSPYSPLSSDNLQRQRWIQASAASVASCGYREALISATMNCGYIRRHGPSTSRVDVGCPILRPGMALVSKHFFCNHFIEVGDRSLWSR